MKNIFYFMWVITLAHFGTISLQAEKAGHEINVRIEGCATGDTLKLGYHYGNKQYMQDTSVVSAEGFATFEGEEALDGGVYFVVIPDHGYFEFLVDEQYFTLETKLDDYIKNMKVTGSKENEIFYNYLNFIHDKKEVKKGLQEQKETEKNEKKLASIQKKLDKLDEEVNDYRKKMNQKNSKSFYVKYLNAHDEPEIPEPPKNEDGTIDSTFRFKYYKAHFFDNMDFTDTRFTRTPLYQQKITQYLDKLTPQIPDSLNKAVDYIIEKSRPNESLFKYLTISLLNKYAKSKIMGMDAIYVHMIDTYYAKGETPWVDSVQLFKMKDRANTIRPNLIGKKAPPLRLKDDKGQWHDIHKMDAPYIVLYFWDPDCGHCKKSTPKVLQFSKDYKEKGVEVIGITTEHEGEKWFKYINEHKLDWINLADLKYQNNFRKLYDISGTPRIFILDPDRTIIAKRIGADNLPGFMDRILGK